MTSLIHENTGNLTSLWQKVGEKAGGYTAGLAFDSCALYHTDWPNRLWFHQDVTAEGLAAAKSDLTTLPTKLLIPCWDDDQERAGALFERAGFRKVSEQVGMSLRLTRTYVVAQTLSLVPVSTTELAILWEAVFNQAFRYQIGHELLTPTYPDIRFLLAFHQGKAVGTVLLHHAPKPIIGIHSMGVIPEMRGKGFAEQMMILLLNQALEQEIDYAVLQASAMGKGLYLKLGFDQQFVMSNYSLPQT
ncbi:GNAT family N-acetyltransferase [Fibrella aquatilis]|uniref:GNAT family N-acetyltransferase n=1 Tax=Fibrella aquatilis TaxID=2817059 RepID=A0A939G413_9BACT|nr:GNAT family N-acetyltransferase [Fibrella aquatilis]MBO0931962.1 GNAT family N-acetyltransferase [Fibrella aquatilis]